MPLVTVTNNTVKYPVMMVINETDLNVYITWNKTINNYDLDRCLFRQYVIRAFSYPRRQARSKSPVILIKRRGEGPIYNCRVNGNRWDKTRQARAEQSQLAILTHYITKLTEPMYANSRTEHTLESINETNRLDMKWGKNYGDGCRRDQMEKENKYSK
jgi:hypothetical protein